MLKYQKRSDYKGIKREADRFYKELLELKQNYLLSRDKEKPLERLKEFYEESHKSRLYNERGGLYCQILCDVNDNL